MDFVLRTIVYVCAFAGAGWFVVWAKDVIEQHGSWPTDFTVVIIVAVVGGVLVSYLRTKKPLG